MTRPLTFTQASEQAQKIGYKLISYAGSSNAYGSVFECQCGYRWSAKHNNVVSSNKTGCPKCAAKATKFSHEDVRNAIEAEGLTLTSIDTEILGGKTIVTTSCPKGHIRTCKLHTIIYSKKPCPTCSKEARGVDFSGINARLSKLGYRLTEWAGTTRTNGDFVCECGGNWSARVASVLQEQSHCPVCFDGGFRGDRPAVFYIYEIRKDSKVRYGYGISGRFKARDAEHKRNAAESGWKIKLYKIFNTEVGAKALAVEKKAKGLFKVPSDMFYGFKTEAIMPRNLKELLRLSENLIDS